MIVLYGVPMKCPLQIHNTLSFALSSCCLKCDVSRSKALYDNEMTMTIENKYYRVTRKSLAH